MIYSDLFSWILSPHKTWKCMLKYTSWIFSTFERCSATPEPLCNIVHYNMVLNITLIRVGPQIAILTHLAYIANGKKLCSVLQQFTGRKCVMLLGAVLWRHPSHHPCLLDVRQCNVVLRVKNVRNTCKRLRCSQIFGGISSVQWRKIGRVWRIQLLFHRF